MENNKIVYITKKDCEKRGFIRLANGGCYKCNTIEKYVINGYLDNAKYDAITLLSTAYTFYKDYYDANIEKLSAIDPSKTVVDGTGNYQISEATDRYNRAIRILPKKMLNIVKRVCCEDKEILVSNSNKHLFYIYIKLLTLGLCLLTKHYLHTYYITNEHIFYTQELTNEK